MEQMYLCLLKQCAVANELQEKKKESNFQFNTPSFAIPFFQSRDGPLPAHAEPKAGLTWWRWCLGLMSLWLGNLLSLGKLNHSQSRCLEGSCAKGAELLWLATLLCHLMWGQTNSFRTDQDFTSPTALLSVKFSHGYGWFSFGINQVWLWSHAFDLPKTLSMLSA